MSSQTPSVSNDFAVTDAHSLTSDLWTAAFAEVFGEIRTLQTAAANFETAVSDAAVAVAQGLMTGSVIPQLDDFQTAMADYNQQLALAEDRLVALQQGGVGGENVTLTAINGMVATNAQAAFAEVKADLTTLGESLTASVQSLTTAITNEATARQEADAQILSNSSSGGMVAAMIWS